MRKILRLAADLCAADGFEGAFLAGDFLPDDFFAGDFAAVDSFADGFFAPVVPARVDRDFVAAALTPPPAQ